MTPATPTITSALELSGTALAALFTRSFEGYFVPMAIDGGKWSEIVRTASIDLALSQVARRGSDPVGCLFAAVRGHTVRVAGMGVVPEARGQGVGRALMDSAVGAFRRAGLARCVLEVIDGNDAALALYRSFGFRIVRSLVGWERPAQAGPAQRRSGPGEALVSADPVDVARAMVREGGEREGALDLPWQLAPESVAAQGPQRVGFALPDRAWAVVSAPTADRVQILALVGRCAADRIAMLEALAAGFEGRRWSAPAVWPAGRDADVWRAAGFEPAPLKQLQLTRDLADDPAGPPSALR